MTNPNSENQPQRNNRRFWLVLLTRSSIAFSVLLLASIVGGAWWGWIFIHQKLAPLVEKNVEQLLGRPIELGKVESLSPNNLRFNSLSIPATATDPDRLAARGIDVQFNPLEVITSRTLKLNITIIQPDVYIEQERNGRWVSTIINTKAKAKSDFIQTELETIKLQNGDLVLKPFSSAAKPKVPVGLTQLNGVASFLEQNQRITFDVTTVAVKGGNLQIGGETRPATKQTTINVRTQNLLASEASQLLNIPLSLQAGSVNTDLTVKLQNNQPRTALEGSVDLNQVTAQIASIPQKFNNTVGKLQFQGEKVVLDNIVTRFGNVPAQAKGVVDLQTGFNVAAVVNPVNVNNLLNTFNIKLPIAATAEVQANLQLQGAIQQPIITGNISTTKPAKIDRLDLNKISSSFVVTPKELVLSQTQIFPTAGGEITGGGKVGLGTQKQVNLNFQGRNVPGDAIAQIYGVSPNIKVGTVSANAQVSGVTGDLQTVVQLQAPAATYPGKAEIAINNTGGVQLRDAVFQVANGTLQATGQLAQGRFQAAVNASRLQLGALAKLPPQFQGLLNGKLNLSGTTAAAQTGTIQANGGGIINVAGGTINLRNIRLDGKNWQIVANASQIPLSNVAKNLPGRLVNSELRLAGTTDSLQLPNIQAAGRANFAVANGTVSLRDIQLNGGRWQTFADVSQIQLNNLSKNLPGRLNSANFRIAGNTNSFQIADIQAAGRANFAVANGTVNLRDVQLQNGRWQTFADVSQIQLSNLSKNLPGRLNSANFRIAGNTNSLQIADIQAAGRANLAVANGTINLRDVQLQNGRWQTLANLSQVQLSNFSNNLRGRLGGNVQLAGTTASFQPTAIQAAGQVNFSQVAVLNQPLTAQFQWNGEQLQILQATAPGLNANGTVAVQQGTQTPQISGFNLNVSARGYNLQNIPVKLPGNIALAGLVDYTGIVAGTPTLPVAAGNVELRNLKINNYAFDPLLTGQVTYDGQGTQFQVSGKQDQIAFSLGANYRPTAFTIQLNEAVAIGTSEGENLLVNVRDFPVALVENFIPKNPNLQPLAGAISGNLAVNLGDNLAQTTAVGNVAISQPRIGRVTANEFSGRIAFADNTVSLTNGELQQGENRYSLSGNLPLAANRQFQFQVGFDSAKIQNLLQGFNIYDIADIRTGLRPPLLGNAAALSTQRVSLPDASLLTQLRQFSQLETKLTQQQQQIARREATRLPTLEELKGILSGQIAVTGSLRSGLNANFNIQGSDLVWGNYNFQRIVAQGNYANGIVSLLPLQINSDQTVLAFSGQVGQKELAGQAQVQALPLEKIKPFLPQLPVDITGNLNALANFAGSLQNPAANGELALVGGSLNNQNIQSAQVNFNYNNARLNFGSNVLVTGTEPVSIAGNIPAKLPFASVSPDSDSIALNVNVKDEGIALLNLFTNQARWESGQGQVNVQVNGTLKQPTATGVAAVQNATIKAQALEKPLTDVTGTVRLEGDRLNVENLQALYSGEQLTAAGILPILANQNAQQQAAANPLTIALNNLRLNFQQLYQGGVTGNVVIGGTAFAPKIGGDIRLSNGRVSLARTPNAAATSKAKAVDTNAATPTTTATTSTTPIEFANLRLFLDDNVRVTRPPLISFLAKGDITLNGTLAKPRPQGEIRLVGGQVNLFTTQFALARGYEQTAIFTPSQGFDPTLDVRLVALVPEVTGFGNGARTSPVSSEVNDVSAINFGRLNSVRVQARVSGPASELSDNLELTSQPGRSEAEIVALLGGSIINSAGQTDAFLGIANLASSALLSNVQGTISRVGERIGLSQLRLYPTTVTNTRSNVSVLGLAAEAGIDISNDLSFSLSRVFATDEPFRYSLLYRLNDQVLFRSSTNLSDDSRAEVEYETRF